MVARHDDEDRVLESFGFGAPGDAWLGYIRAAEAPLPAPGIGRFEVVEEVSRGGQGVVYRARDPDSGRQVALKRLVAGSFATASMRRRLERELEAVSILEHPNIVSAFGLEMADGVPVLAMEWVDGVAITKWATSNGRRDVTEVVRVFLQICDAVTYAHQRGIIHRDLKPSNIMIDRNDEPLVLDFGLAKMVPSDGSEQSEAMTSEFVGTLAYASPEQIRGACSEVDVRSDVYSLGVILYELLTGRRPYQFQGGLAQAAQLIERSDPARPASIAAHLDRDLEAIALKALARGKAARYQSAESLAADLRSYLAGEPVTARVPGAFTRLAHTIRRHRLAAAFAATVFGLVAVFGAVSAVLAVQYARQHDRAVLEADKAREVSTFLQEMLASVDPMRRNTDLTVRDVLEAASLRIDSDLAGQPAIEASIRLVIGVTYHSLGGYDEAEPHLQRALALQSALHHDDHADVAIAMNELGHLMTSLGRYPEAEQLLNEALRMSRAVHGNEHLAVAKVLNNRAKIMYMRGEIAESEPLWREALEIRRRLLGDEHPLVAASLANLASCLHRQGDYQAAEPLYREVLALLRKLLGEDHSDVGDVLHLLAALLRDTGAYADAAAMHRQSLAVKRKALGDDHPNVGFTLSGLGKTLYLAGDYEQAESAYREALAVYEKSMQREHPRVAVALAGLGRSLAALGDRAAAEATLEEAHDICSRLLGDAHPETVEAREALAELRR
ncbi:MAG: serine/threonine protein kinase [Planctomycetota bacterium]